MKKALLIFLSLSFLLGIVYTLCVAPSVHWEDSGEFITTAKNLGIAHPPGHPLYIVLSHIFTLISSFKKTALAVNMFSVFISSLTLFFFSVFLYLLLRNDDKTLFYPVLFSSLLLFAFSKTFWYYTEIAEVYSLHTLLSILLFISLFLFLKHGEKFILLFSYLFGLSLTNNITIGFLFPAFLIFIILEKRRLKKRLFFYSFLLFLLGISFYLFVPFRSKFHPVFNWGNAQTLKNFFSLILVKDFSRGFLSLEYTEKTFVPFILNLLREIAFWGIVPLFLGFYKLFKKEKNLFILFISSILFNICLSFLTGRGPDFYAYFLPTIPLLFILIGLGISYILDLLKGKRTLIFATLFIAFSLLSPILNHKENCRRRDYDAMNYGTALLDWLPANAILLTENTNDFFILTYLKEVERKNRIDIFYLPLFREEWYRDYLRLYGFEWEGTLTPLSFSQATNRECFYTPGPGISVSPEKLLPSGPLFRITESKEPITATSFTLPPPLHRKGKKRYAILFSRFGEYYFLSEEFKFSIDAFEKAKIFEPENPAIYHNLSILYGKLNNIEKSLLNKNLAEQLGYKK